MNVLYIGPYYQLDAWGMTAYSYLQALNTIDINLVCRHIDFGNVKREKEDWITQLENKAERKYDRVIQVVPPNYLVYGPNYYSITICEPTCLVNKEWIRKLNNIDNIIVGSESERQSLIFSGVKNNIRTIPPCIDIESSYSHYDLYGLDTTKYNFYWIGEYGDRTNYKDVLLAFHSEFNREDDVGICFYFIHEPTQEFANHITKEFINLKSQLNKYRGITFYKNDDVKIGKNINEIKSLHQHGNCFVYPILGGNPDPLLLDAMLFNSEIITTIDIPYNISKYSITLGERPIYNSYNYDCGSLWLRPDVNEMSDVMRMIFLNNKTKKYNIEELSPKNIGRMLVNALSI